jgi:rhodanese-related sulfurtransferase
MKRSPLYVSTLPALALALIGCGPDTSDKDIEFITTAEVRSLTLNAETNPKAVLLIDPRSPKAYADGHLPRARNMELWLIEYDGKTKKWIEAYSDIVVYGDDPGSAVAKAMTKRLLHVGYGDVRMYEGGVLEWRKAGFPIETGEQKDEEAGAATPAPSEEKTSAQ